MGAKDWMRAAGAAAAAVLTAIGGAAMAADIRAGEKDYQGLCQSCHGAGGASIVPAQPILAGQVEEYLAAQTRLYKSGERANAVMGALAQPLSEAQIDNIAAYLAAQQPAIAGAADAQQAAAGEKLYRNGDHARGIPGCTACHGPAGEGIAPLYPRLSGQHADYAETTMKEFRSGAREHAVMNAIAAQLTDEEIAALAHYMSGLAR